MMKKMIDACGLACPAPVLLVKDAVEQKLERYLTVHVDNEASKENVGRFLRSKGYSVTDSKEGDVFILQACNESGLSSDTPEAARNILDKQARQKVLIVIKSDCFGSGDDELGRKLMINYLRTLKEMGGDLWQLIFVNGGVRLTVESSAILRELQEYEASGVIILACGTCLEHFGLTAQKKVGATTNMLDIVAAMQYADKVISIS